MREALAQPVGVVGTTEEFASEIKSQILHRLGRQIRQLQVVVQDGGVVLRGSVSSYYSKQLAQQAVMEMGGLIRTNDIEVR